MDPKEQQDQNKEYIEWSEEAKKNMLELMLTRMEMEEEQKHMTEEEKAEEFGIGQGQGERDSEGKSSFAMGASSLEESWKTISERMQVDAETFGKQWGDLAGGFLQNLKESFQLRNHVMPSQLQ